MDSKHLQLLKVAVTNTLAVLPFLLVFSFIIVPHMKSSIVERRKQQIRATVDTAYGTLLSYQEKAKQGLSVEQAKKDALEQLRGLRYEGQEYFWVNDLQPVMLMHPMKPELEGKSIAETTDPTGKKIFMEMLRALATTDSAHVDYQWPKPGQENPVPKFSYIRKFAPWGWVLGSGVYADDLQLEVDKFSSQAYRYLAIGALFSILVSMMSGIWYARKTLITVATTCARLEESSKVSTSVAKDLRDVAVQVSSCNTEQAASMEETVASIEKIVSIVNLNRDAAMKALDISSGNVNSAQDGFKASQSLIQAIQEIQQSSFKIKNILEVIDDIAFQTNLLALNASVEAARAGDHGKGFAVVADAVRALAHRSAASAKEIGSLIQESTEKVKKGVGIAEATGKSLQTILESAQKVSNFNREIATTSREQSEGLGEISQAMGQIDKSTQQNSVSAEKAREYADQVYQQSELIENEINRLKEILGTKAVASGEAVLSSS